MIGAVQHPAVAVAASGRPHAARVGAEVRLGEAEAGADQPALFLLVAANVDSQLDEVHAAMRDEKLPRKPMPRKPPADD